MTDTHRDTVMRLMVEVGDGCRALMDEQMRKLSCKRVQVDEIWAYVGKKQRQVTGDDDRREVGDQWTFVAIDADTKLVPCFRVGKRTKVNAISFMTDLSDRLANRVQLSSDARNSYVDAVEAAFGAEVDYGQLVKIFEAEPIGPGRYSPPGVVGHRAAGAAEVDKTFILLALKDLLVFNVDDYLTPAEFDAEGNVTKRRRLDLSKCTPEQLYRVAEHAEVLNRHGSRMKIKGHDKLAILAQLAKTAGIDRDQTAEAVTGIGQRLAAALKRFNANVPSNEGRPPAAIAIRRDR